VAGSPNAHFSCRRATDAAVMLAALADWNRAFTRSGLHPFQPGVDVRSLIGAVLAQRLLIALTSPLSAAPSLRPETHSAISRFWISVSSAAWLFMFPVVSAS